ncbi:MAG: trypsin-like peptidase domain-containing protein [Acidobacteria bacterium]|nr:trypsin-like peptidase domain-containing protein [Acidobacteriota bacterium]
MRHTDRFDRALIFWMLLLTAAGSALITVLVLWKLGFVQGSEAGSKPPVLAEAPPHFPRKFSPDEEESIRVYEQLSNAVVNITTVEVSYDFFLEPTREEGTGSGVVMDNEGHILTNHHVIKNADYIQVTLADKSKYKAEVRGIDAVNDLAILKINAPKELLTPIPLGTSRNLRVGQKVYAIGNPFGLSRTMSAGIISSLGRSIKSNSGFVIDGVIQTDAAINPGNSGGPLIDSQGKMIGLNTSIFTTHGGNIGIGFAVPVATVVRVGNDLIREGRVRRPWIGIHGIDVTPDLARYLNLPEENGVLVEYVDPGSSAARAGVRGGNTRALLGRMRLIVNGDFIVQVDGRPVTSNADLAGYLLNLSPGETVKMNLYRNGRKVEISVPLLERGR